MSVKLGDRYYLSSAPGSVCPGCNRPVKMLAKADMTGSSFYICFRCLSVGQIGVGPVADLNEHGGSNEGPSRK